MENNQKFDAYKKAQQKVKEIKSFYIHAIVYFLVMTLLTYINLRFTPDHFWVLYSMTGWGFGLLGHGAQVFNWLPFLNKEWEQKKLEQFIKEEEGKLNNQKYQ